MTSLLKKADLDWDVELQSLHTKDGKLVQNRRALVRTDTKEILDVVGPKYIPTQNREVFKFFDDFASKNSLELVHAGTTNGGQLVYAQAKLPEKIVLPGNDESEAYLILSHPHQWGKALNILFSTVRLVCQNRLTMAMNNSIGDRVRMSHLRAFDLTMQDNAGLVLDQAKHQIGNYKDVANLLRKHKCSDEDAQAYYATLFQPNIKQIDSETKFNRTVDTLMELRETQPGAKMGAGSWWQSFNAVTYFVDHVQGRDPTIKEHRTVFGQGAATKRKALSLAETYVTA